MQRTYVDLHFASFSQELRLLAFNLIELSVSHKFALVFHRLASRRILRRGNLMKACPVVKVAFIKFPHQSNLQASDVIYGGPRRIFLLPQHSFSKGFLVYFVQTQSFWGMLES